MQGRSSAVSSETSQVTAPFKGVLQRCAHNREALLVQLVDTTLLADAETAYGIC
jgi:hypothetical protein